MSDNLKIKLRALSLGVLPSDAQELGTEISGPVMNSELVVRKQPSIDGSVECSPPETLVDERKNESRPRSVTFQDDLPGSPIHTSAQSEPSHASNGHLSAQDDLNPNKPPPPSHSPSVARHPASIRRSATEYAPTSLSPSSSTAAAISLSAQPPNSPSGGAAPQRRVKTFKIQSEVPKRGNSANSFHASARTNDAAMTSSKNVQKYQAGRRFSVLYGALDLPEEYNPPENSVQSDDSNPNVRKSRRRGVYLKKQFSSVSLNDIDKHVKDLARMDFAFAMLSLGGLGLAVSANDEESLCCSSAFCSLLQYFCLQHACVVLHSFSRSSGSRARSHTGWGRRHTCPLHDNFVHAAGIVTASISFLL